mgnify:CR=1 FL=1
MDMTLYVFLGAVFVLSIAAGGAHPIDVAAFAAFNSAFGQFTTALLGLSTSLNVAIEAAPVTDRGVIAFYDATTLQLLKTVEAGALPDAVAFSNTGHFVIAANEGEPKLMPESRMP